jgi:hypothetical protein
MTRRDLGKWACRYCRCGGTSPAADDTADLIVSPARVEYSCDDTLQQGIKPVRYEFSPALEAQPPSELVDQRPNVCPVVESLSVGACRGQDEFVGHLVRAARVPPTLSGRIRLLPNCSLPLLLAPFRLLHSTTLSAIGSHLQMMPGRCITAMNGLGPRRNARQSRSLRELATTAIYEISNL